MKNFIVIFLTIIKSLLILKCKCEKKEKNNSKKYWDVYECLLLYDLVMTAMILSTITKR